MEDKIFSLIHARSNFYDEMWRKIGANDFSIERASRI